MKAPLAWHGWAVPNPSWKASPAGAQANGDTGRYLTIWIDHLRSGSPALAALLENEAACTHDVVIGESAFGNRCNRAELLGLLQTLPRLPAATEGGAIFFIEQQRLMGRGIDNVDVHLLAAAVIRKVSSCMTSPPVQIDDSEPKPWHSMSCDFNVASGRRSPLYLKKVGFIFPRARSNI